MSLKNTSHTRKQYIDATISFLGLLAGYLELHLRRAWAPLLFDDEALGRIERPAIRLLACIPRHRLESHRRLTVPGSLRAKAMALHMRGECFHDRFCDRFCSTR